MKRGKGPHGKKQLRKLRLKIQALNHPPPMKVKGADKRTSGDTW